MLVTYFLQIKKSKQVVINKSFKRRKKIKIHVNRIAYSNAVNRRELKFLFVKKFTIFQILISVS